MESPSRRALRVGALYGLLSVIFCAPLFKQPLGLGIADWDQHLFYYAEVLKNLIERSEEHTSELQSLTNLVCRLLLEKKKKTK